jgi:hypothetical protein
MTRSGPCTRGCWASRSEAKRELVNSAAASAMTHQGADATFGIPEKSWLLTMAAMGD